MAFRNLTRLTVKGGLAGGTVYYYYSTGLWRDSDTTIQSYDKLRKDVDRFLEANPQVAHVVETGQSHLSSTIAPATEAVSNFRKEWLDFDLYWLGNGDGIVKPAWNKSIAWICDFLAHAPEDLKYVANEGWEKLSQYTSEASTAKSSPKV